MANPLVCVHTADIHFGAMDERRQYLILKQQMLDPLQNMHFDAFFINGDLFHHKCMSNSQIITYATQFVNDVINLCYKNNATLVILHGTESHDAKQLQIFYGYTKYVDVRIIMTTQFIDIKGTKILCIPEEYKMGEDYYRDYLYFTQDYDMAVLHGSIKGAIFGMNKVDLSGRTPVFGIESFARCRGPIVCGHVHIAKCFDGHIYYCGSPLRWQFGESEDKGFLICMYNPLTYQYYMHFQVIESDKYETVNLTNMLSFNPQAIIDYIQTLRANNNIYHLKVKFDESNAATDFVKQYFSSNPAVKIESVDTRFVQIVERNKQDTSNDFDQYGYLLDTNLTPEQIFTRYVNQKTGEQFITTEELDKLLASAE